MSKYDEPNPHWCDCTSDGKWKDSTLSIPISHDPIHNYNPASQACQCVGWLGYTHTPYCTLLWKWLTVQESIIQTWSFLILAFCHIFSAILHFRFTTSIFWMDFGIKFQTEFQIDFCTDFWMGFQLDSWKLFFKRLWKVQYTTSCILTVT